MLRSADVVIGYDTTCWITAERCKVLGSLSYRMQSTPVSKERIYRQIAAYPEMENQIKPKKDLYINYERKELATPLEKALRKTNIH